MKQLAKGIGAGLIGTTGMTALQELSILVRKVRADGSGASEERSEDPWSHAPAPAQVAKRMLETVFHREVHADRIKLLTNLTHWGYGTGLGVAYAVVGRRLGVPGPDPAAIVRVQHKPTSRGIQAEVAPEAVPLSLFTD